MDYERWMFDVSSLSFLLETEYRDYLGQLLIAESKYQTAAKILNERSKLHEEIAQPLIENAGMTQGVKYSKQQYVNALGERVATKLSRMTDDAIEHIDDTVVFLETTRDKLHEALSKLYPEAKIIRFEPINKPAQSPQ